MQHLPEGVKDEEGCFVYQITTSNQNGIDIAVRSELSLGDECFKGLSFKDGELVSVDLVRPSRVSGSKYSPFLRLSEASEWLFERKYGDIVMKRMSVAAGLWAFFVDNGSTGIALCHHPVDRSDVTLDDVSYEPMQQIYCDRKVRHPDTGVNFYRVQSTEGWVFDRRLPTTAGKDDSYMLLDDDKVEMGLHVYESILPLAV
jgi:hypothetical protein